MKPTSKPTLKTIAQISDLAIATVSRALGDAPDISSETKERVRKIANEIGYVPNRAGVRLRTGRTNVISLVLPVESNMSNHTAKLQSSIALELRGTQFHLNVTPLFEDEDPLKPIRHIVENGLADGIIINSTRPRDDRVAYMMDRGFPFATHGRTDWCENHPYFDFDNTTFVELAAQHLFDLGRRHIKIILPPAGQNYTNNMLDGIATAEKSLGIRIEKLTGIDGDMPSDKVNAAMSQILVRDPQTDGIIATSPMACIAVVNAAETLGKKLGVDLDIFSREAIPFLKLFRPQLHVIQEDVGWVGTHLARAVVQAIRNPTAPPMQGLEVPQASNII